jgi:hypothetical protein
VELLRDALRFEDVGDFQLDDGRAAWQCIERFGVTERSQQPGLVDAFVSERDDTGDRDDVVHALGRDDPDLVANSSPEIRR